MAGSHVGPFLFISWASAGSRSLPVLYTFYKRDIFEAFGPRVKGVIYADDTFIYSSGPSLEDVCRDIQNSLYKVSRWCSYWKLSVNPSKCSAIVFSRRKVSKDIHLKFQGEDIPWVDSIRILGLIFDRGLTWSSHISVLKGKAQKKLNVLKCISHAARGISTRLLLRLAHSTVISTLNFGSQVYSTACSTTRKRLEPIQNAALRIATGLPRWTPIPLLRREAKALSVSRSQDLIRERFFLRQLALGPQSSLFSCDTLSQPSAFANSTVDSILSRLQIQREHILHWSFPHPLPENFLEIHENTLDFQNKQLPHSLLTQLFSEYIAKCTGWHLMATDASKTASRTSLGVWDITLRRGFSSNVNTMNSVFTSEALAIISALDSAPAQGKLIVFSDSRSVISSLQNVTFRSPKVILTLHSTLQRVANRLSGIRIIWVPGHVGIYANEMADAMARHLISPRAPTPWLAPEDICFHLRYLHLQEDSVDWLTGKYCGDFPHLTKRSWEHRKLQLPRKGEVLLSRLRTRTLPTQALLFKLHLSASPLCPACLVPETCDHFLLHCTRYHQARDILYQRLGISGTTPSLSDLCDLAVAGNNQARCLVAFILRTDRF